MTHVDYVGHWRGDMARDEKASDATTLGAADLLRNAARLVERALIQLDMQEAACPHCDARTFANREHARVYEAVTNIPERLRNAAERLQEADRVGPVPSFGFAYAQHNRDLATR